MGNHEVTYHEDDPQGLMRHWAKCKCRWESFRHSTKQLAEDDVLTHLRYIEKIRTHLGTRTPSLAQQRAYFRARAQDPYEDAKWVPIWQQLADELDQRLNDAAHEPYEQLNLTISEEGAT